MVTVTKTKQEAIREGIYKQIRQDIAGHSRTNYLVDGIMNYLHDNDVVKKVDRELPEIKKLPEEIFENNKDTIHTKMCYLAGVKDYQEKVKDGGYTAVEPLIEVSG